MGLIAELTLPFFAVVGLGYLTARLGWLPANGVRAINVFVFNFAMPALVINALARQAPQDLLDASLFAGWLTAALGLYAVSFVLARTVLRDGRAAAALFAQAASIGNLGFLALPLLIVALGERVAVPFSVVLIVDLVIVIPLSIAIVESASASAGFGSALGKALRGAVANPFFLAIAAACALAFSGIGVPGPASRFVEFLAGAAGPAALFSLGATLAARTLGAQAVPIALASVIKLAVHPVLIWFALGWLEVDAFTRGAATVMAAMPIAGNVFVIAESYGTTVQRLSAAIVVSTIIAVVTVALALEWTGLSVQTP